MFLLSCKKTHFMGLKTGHVVRYTLTWPLSKWSFSCVTECLGLSLRRLSSRGAAVAAQEEN